MNRKGNLGFSLVELVIVMVILAVISAIALPRISRGANGADDSALGQNLAVLRSAIEMYAAEHGGQFPTVTNFVNQMTQYSDRAGDTSATRDETTGKTYGPYLYRIPPLTVGDNAGQSNVAATPGPGVGWIYDDSTGKLSANVASGLTGPNGVDYAEW
jgi:general secretion pathway protein G